MDHLINNELENLKALEQLVSFLFEIEQELFGPQLEPAEAYPSEPAPSGIVHRLSGIQTDMRHGLSAAHRVVQRLRENTGVVEASPKKSGEYETRPFADMPQDLPRKW